MNKAQIKCLAVFSVFAVIGFGPISPGCLIGMAVVILRPRWFGQLLIDLYTNKTMADGLDDQILAEQSQRARKKAFLSFLTLFIIDIVPVPVTPVIAFVIILARPVWFYRLFATVYQFSGAIAAKSGEDSYVRTS
jgi:hypothetical protein